MATVPAPVQRPPAGRRRRGRCAARRLWHGDWRWHRCATPPRGRSWSVGCGPAAPCGGSGPRRRGPRLRWRKARPSVHPGPTGQTASAAEGATRSAGKWSAAPRDSWGLVPRRQSRPASGAGPSIQRGWRPAGDGPDPLPASRVRSRGRGDSRQQLQGLLQIGLQIGEVFTAH